MVGALAVANVDGLGPSIVQIVGTAASAPEEEVDYGTKKDKFWVFRVMTRDKKTGTLDFEDLSPKKVLDAMADQKLVAFPDEMDMPAFTTFCEHFTQLETRWKCFFPAAAEGGEVDGGDGGPLVCLDA